MCSGLARRARGDRLPSAVALDAVVIEHGHAVGAEPHVVLQAGGAQLEGEFDRRGRVLRRLVARAEVGEADGRVEQRRQPLLHDR